MESRNQLVPNYTITFKFENEFQPYKALEKFNQHWTICFYVAAAYVLVIFTGQKWMANRPRYELRTPLILWNVMLATFSIIGASRTIPEIFHVTRNIGLHHSVCVQSYAEDDKVASFWTLLFVLSKMPELVDTVFIVLRKQPLIFLHWYHHATVLIYSWYAYSEFTAPARWFVTMNYTVHSMMYSYYALKALRIPVPKFVSMVITLSQLTQMVFGCAVNIWAYQWKQNDVSCHVSELNIKLSLLMYFSYFILFARFFYKAYVYKRPDRKEMHGAAVSAANGSTFKKIQ